LTGKPLEEEYSMDNEDVTNWPVDAEVTEQQASAIAKTLFAEAQEAAKLRGLITEYAAGAVKYGLDRDWVNAQLARLGAEPVKGVSEYRMNVAIEGLYGWRCNAHSRAEALERFNNEVSRVQNAGKINSCGVGGRDVNVYDVSFVGEPAFYSGPEDATEAVTETLGLDDLKAGIRSMLKLGVARYDWNYRYANIALAAMGLDALPELTSHTVYVPVAGTAELHVMGFAEDDAAEVQAAAVAKLAKAPSIWIKPSEVGTVTVDKGESGTEGDVSFSIV
jgi:hypothetical protein